MFVQACGHAGGFGPQIGFLLPGCKLRRGDERHFFVQKRRVACPLHVFGRDARQPQQVIGESRAQPKSCVWMPPVQDIAFDELLTCVTQNLRSGHVWPVVNQCGRILKLISKPKRAARLIIRGAPHIRQLRFW